MLREFLLRTASLGWMASCSLGMISFGHFATVCQEWNPKNITPVQQPPFGVVIPVIPPLKVTVDGATFNVSWPWCNSVQHVPNKRTGSIAPEVSSVQIIRATPIAYTASVITDLPSAAVVQGQTFINCSATATTQMTTLSVALARTLSTTLTNTVSNGGSFTLGLMDKVSEASTVSGSLTFTSTNTTAKAAMQGTTTTITKSDSISVTVPPKTALTATIQIHPVQYKQGFSATVTVDGPFEPYECSMEKCPKKVDDCTCSQPHRAKSLSHRLRSRFPVAGFLTSTDSSQATTATYDSTLPSDCSNGNKSLQVVAMRARK